jgi:hypothetical protein
MGLPRRLGRRLARRGLASWGYGYRPYRYGYYRPYRNWGWGAGALAAGALIGAAVASSYDPYYGGYYGGGYYPASYGWGCAQTLQWVPTAYGWRQAWVTTC